ncbi:MAG: response regulator [Desulfobacteraceae bacterium]|nr:MAG: response regulator [Desulfobacteraceae bacterium]
MSKDRREPNELVERLAQAEAALDALRRGEVDLVVGPDALRVVRLKPLVEENERLAREWRTTFDAVKDAIFVLDADQRILRCNRAAEKLFERPGEELLGKHCWEIVHGTAEPIPECPILRMRQSLQRETMDLSIGDRWFEVEVDPILDAKNRLTGAVNIISDITERKKAEKERAVLHEQLQQAQKLESIGRLAGGVAHDFNNILSVILGYGDILLGKLHQQDPMRDEVREIVTAGRRAEALIRQLLAFSRKQTLQPQVLDLNEQVRNLEKMLRRLIGEDIALDLALAEDLPPVLFDPGQLDQVIINLAVNSRDAMPKGGKLLIETSAVELDKAYAAAHTGASPGEYVLLAVTDTGCGMDKETAEKIFEPFFTTKEKGKGTGLGLSTVYGIVKQSGGNIWVYSEPGKGTTFKIYLPQTEEKQKTREKIVASQEISGGEHILVVEDEESVRNLIKSALTRLGYSVTLAANGGEALLLVEEKGLKPDLVITDVVMPNMGGKELIDRLRRTYPGLGALFMSGYTDNAIVHHGVLDQDTPFIQKPFTLQELGRKVHEVLASKPS